MQRKHPVHAYHAVGTQKKKKKHMTFWFIIVTLNEMNRKGTGSAIFREACAYHPWELWTTSLISSVGQVCLSGGTEGRGQREGVS